jgi:DNA ligase-1
VEPRVVVEVLFNEIQASSQDESGLALRFARMFRLREDKTPEETDTMQAPRRIFRQQFEQKGQPQETNRG